MFRLLRRFDEGTILTMSGNESKSKSTECACKSRASSSGVRASAPEPARCQLRIQFSRQNHRVLALRLLQFSLSAAMVRRDGIDFSRSWIWQRIVPRVEAPGPHRASFRPQLIRSSLGRQSGPRHAAGLGSGRVGTRLTEAICWLPLVGHGCRPKLSRNGGGGQENGDSPDAPDGRPVCAVRRLSGLRIDAMSG